MAKTRIDTETLNKTMTEEEEELAKKKIVYDAIEDRTGELYDNPIVDGVTFTPHCYKILPQDVSNRMNSLYFSFPCGKNKQAVLFWKLGKRIDQYDYDNGWNLLVYRLIEPPAMYVKRNAKTGTERYVNTPAKGYSKCEQPPIGTVIHHAYFGTVFGQEAARLAIAEVKSFFLGVEIALGGKP